MNFYKMLDRKKNGGKLSTSRELREQRKRSIKKVKSVKKDKKLMFKWMYDTQQRSKRKN